MQAALQPDAAPAQNGPDPVKEAVATIESSLSEGILDWDVSHSDLRTAHDALTALPPAQQSEVFAQLSDETIQHWMSEVNGARGAYSAAEKDGFFRDLATGLDATQLARVIDNTRYLGDGERLGTAIGRYGGAEKVAEFVDIMGDTLTGPTQTVGNFSTTEDVVARTIGALQDPADIDRALNALTPAEREALATESFPHGGHSPAAFKELYAAVARSNDVGMRTEFFKYAAAHTAELRDQLNIPLVGSDDFPALDPFYEGMTALIERDPRAMVDELANQDVGMRDLVSYLEIGVHRGDMARIGRLGLEVRRGEPVPGASQSDFNRFNYDFNRDPNRSDYRNSTLAGYFTGAAMAAASNVQATEKQRRELAVSILTGGASTAASALPLAGQLIVGAGSLVTQTVASEIETEADAGRQAFYLAMHEAGMPRDGQGHLPRGGARTAFNAAIAEVMAGQGF